MSFITVLIYLTSLLFRGIFGREVGPYNAANIFFIIIVVECLITLLEHVASS
jgi:hypothetical protein